MLFYSLTRKPLMHTAHICHVQCVTGSATCTCNMLFKKCCSTLLSCHLGSPTHSHHLSSFLLLLLPHFVYHPCCQTHCVAFISISAVTMRFFLIGNGTKGCYYNSMNKLLPNHSLSWPLCYYTACLNMPNPRNYCGLVVGKFQTSKARLIASLM